MSILVYDSGPTSNDLLESRVVENNSRALSSLVAAQNAGPVPSIEIAAAVSAGII